MTALKQEQLFDEIESLKVILIDGDEVFKKIANRLNK